MRNLVTIFEKLFSENEEFARRATNYSRAMKTDEWKFLVDAIQLIQGQMSVDMFSRAYTEMSESEKDVVQKTYYNVNQILHFLISPHQWINKRAEYKQRLADQAKRTSKQMGGQTW